MSAETLNLDKLAAERSQAIVIEVRQKAEKEAEEKAKKEKIPIEQTEKAKHALRKRRTETLERLDTKALGVLQEQGVYALMLFLFSRTSDEERVAPVIRAQLYKALKQIPDFKDVPLEESDGPEKVLAIYANDVLNDLDTVLLVRDLYEQTLIYTRYGAKAARE